MFRGVRETNAQMSQLLFAANTVFRLTEVSIPVNGVVRLMVSTYLQTLHKLRIQVGVFGSDVEIEQRDDTLIIVEFTTRHVIQTLAVERLSTRIYDCC